MMEKSGEGMSWTFSELDAFLANPKGEVPGTLMAFVGLKKPDQRADVIAYLRSLADSPVPMPEPMAEAEGAEAAGTGPEAAHTDTESAR
jgi:cytochrome c